MLTLKIVELIAHPARVVNEDLFDHGGQAAWIFDGATGIAKDTIPGAGSDPQWLVQTTSQELKRVWDDVLPTRDLLRRAAEGTIARYNEILPSPPPLIERPTACFAMARIWKGSLEISTLYDSGVLYRGSNGTRTFGCEGSPLAKKIHHERDRLIAEGTPVAQLHELLMPMERDFRSRANSDGGYDIVDTTTRWAERIEIETVETRAGDMFLLTTDGLYRLIDVFGKYDAASLVEAAATRGLSSLYDELRGLEAADAACTQFPRAKISDDVAAALVSLE